MLRDNRTTKEESEKGISEATEHRFGRLDVMVANAGTRILCKTIEMSLADWRRQTALISMAYSCRSNTRFQQFGLRGRLYHHHVLGRWPPRFAGLGGYSAANGGVHLFANAIAIEWAAVATISGSTQSIRASSTRRFGRR